MLSSGTVEIDGKTYVWTSPTLADLEHFEAMVGPITDPVIVNSVKGRVWLAWLCLRKKYPDLTPKLISDWPAAAYLDLWPLVKAAIPFWEVEPVGPTSSSSSSSDAPDGPPPAPAASDSPT